MVGEVEGDGFPVVMIHGLGGSTNMFQPQLAALSRLSRHPPRPAGLGALAAAARAADDRGMTARGDHAPCAASASPRAHFVGHSMGTIVCQQVAANEPALVASLTLFGALAEPPTATREALAKRAQLARSGGMADIADQIVANALSAHTRETNPAAVAFVRESIMRQDPESYARTCEALAKATAVDPRLIAAPTLLVTGDADTVNRAERRAGACRQNQGRRIQDHGPLRPLGYYRESAGEQPAAG